LVVSTSAVDCLERLVSEMTCYVYSGTLTHTHSTKCVLKLKCYWPTKPSKVRPQTDRCNQTY